MARKAVLLAVLLASLALGAATASAAPGVVQELPGCRTATLAANDDGSSAPVPLGFTANMFDSSFSQVYVNNNGNITVDAPQSDYTPFDFRESGAPSVNPLLADVDTTGTGTVSYGTTTYGGRPAFCAIWDHVGYYRAHEDKTNTFQAIIVDQGDAGVDLVFNYDSIAWETGDASGGENGFGGTSAAAGYAAGDGDGAHALMLPGSFTNGGLLDSNPATSLAGHGTAGQPAGRYVFAVREAAPTGGRVIGRVTDPDGDGVAGAVVQLCPEASGSCITRIADADGDYRASNLAAGDYTVTGFPGPANAFSAVTVTGVTVGGVGSTATRDIELGPAPTAPPEGTTIGPRIDDSPESGVPSAYWGDPLQISTQGCPGGHAHYTMALAGRLVREGDLTETPAGSGTFTGTIAALQPDHGTGQITVHFTDCGAAPADDVDFGIYIDPSGVVRDAAGNQAPGATVTLYRSASAAGPFFAVPDGDAVMSPANRTNPDTTDAGGHFGWDVVAGFYVVRAEGDAGCTGRSAVLRIPPPVTDLDIRLSCAPPASGPVLVGGTPLPPATPATQATPARKLARLGKVKLVKGKRLSVKVACAKTAKSACAGKVALRIGKKAVGSRSFKKVKPGRTATVKVKLSRKGRKLVRKVKRGKKVRFTIRVTVRDAAGRGATVSRSVKIKR